MLSDLVMSHFRSHQRTRLAFDGRPVALYGPNGAGKTNILEALSLLSPGRGLRRARAEDIARRPGELGWKVAAQLHGHEVETAWQPGGARGVLIDGKPASQAALARVGRVLWLVPAMDRLWIEGADGRRRFLDRMVLSLIPGHADAALVYEKAMRERNRLLRDMSREAGWYAALEAQMAEAGAAMVANRRALVARLSPALAEQRAGFPSAQIALAAADGDDEPDPAGAGDDGRAEDLAAALARSRSRDMAAGRTLVGPHRADMQVTWGPGRLPSAQCSTGEQKALLISLVLANARVLAGEGGPPAVLLLDEIAAHLDSARRAALYEELGQTGAHAFMTGTGPELFAELAERAQHIEITAADGMSVARERTSP